jgi:hypothetical protein
MLNDSLKKEVGRDQLLYLIGRFLGLFPENSFEQFKSIFEDDNEIQKMLASIYNDLNKCGALCTVEGDKIKWNEKFNVEAYLESQNRHKAAKAAETQVRTKIKGVIRKFISPEQTIQSGNLKVRIKSVDLDLLEIKTIVVTATDEWEKVFKPGYIASWKYVNTFDDMHVFETISPYEAGNQSQNLLTLENGKIAFSRDS